MVVFLSYSRKDHKDARAIESALADVGWEVWRDEVSISAGSLWRTEIDTGLRKANAMVLIVSSSSMASSWVTYEYAFAVGARIAAVAVIVGVTELPEPIRTFQGVRYPSDGAISKIDEGLRRQIKDTTTSPTNPVLVAKFQERDGKVIKRTRGRVPELALEMWVEHAPQQTTRVDFEVLEEVRDPRWSVRRRTGAREFLTHEGFSLYGDVDIMARGSLPTGASWTTESRLYDALLRHYKAQQPTLNVQRALRQIRDN